MFKKISISLVIFFFALSGLANAQFGKNVVIWEKTKWNFHKSDHYDYYVSMDLGDQEIQPHFEELVEHLEGSYAFLSVSFQHNLKRRPIVVVSRTHSQFEAISLSGDPFISEGVGAYALPRGAGISPVVDLVLVVKPDFLPVLNKTIYTHELTHIFQFDMMGVGLIQRLLGVSPVDQWLFEATADYMANIFAPYSRDDIRKIYQRLAAANTKNPEMGLPTLEMLVRGQSNPYTMGAMVFEFLDARYGREATFKFIVDVFKSRKFRFMELLADISKGEFKTPEDFDRAHRDYWAGKYGEDSLKRPQPYSNTSSVTGRQIVKQPYPVPMTSPVLSRDGKSVAFLTYDRKYGIVVAIAKALPRDEPPYIPMEKRKKNKSLLGNDRISAPEPQFKVLTKFMAPKPYEYIVAQEFVTWPFNGSDIDWWQDANWSAEVASLDNSLKEANQELEKLKTDAKDKKEKPDEDRVKVLQDKIKGFQGQIRELRKKSNVSEIAFFARHNRDHALYVIDVNTGKFVVESKEIPLDQAFSPKFSPDGKTIYFSAAKNINRDIYSLNLETNVLANLTKGGVFNSAPAVSPNGNAIAYVSFVGGFQKLFAISVEFGEKVQLTYGRYNDNSPSWSSDGTKLVYTSDQKDNIWNLYTFEIGHDLRDSKIKQWTDIYGGVFMPVFVPGEDGRVVYSGYFETDQFRSYIFPNFKLFDNKLKEPLVSTVVEPVEENMDFSLRSEKNIGVKLDMRQIMHPQKPPARWQFNGNEIQAGYSGYYGGYVFTQVAAQDLLASRTHIGIYAQRGDFKFIDYTYVDQSKRWTRAINGSYSQLPLSYSLYNYNGKLPAYPKPYDDSSQAVLNNTWVKEISATLFTQYPFNKWDRVEFGVRPRQRTFLLPIDVPPELRQEFESVMQPLDVQFYDLFANSSRANIGMNAAFVHDTVMFSGEAGPMNGFAFRGQVEYGAPLSSKSSNYTTASFDARRYFRLSNASVAAFRGVGMTSTMASGDFILLGGTDTLSSYPYFSVAGNQIIYGRGELRIPFADVAFLSAIPMRVRATLFADAGKIRFSDDLFPTRNEWSYGFSFQTNLYLPLNFEFARTRFEQKKFLFNVRIGFSY